jgi:mannose-1-phosphate guanylyltransferase
MDAMILAAGAGTRLLPLTRTKPKPLFPILNQPLLQITFDTLSRLAVRRVILNTHHLAAQIQDFVESQKKERPFEIQTCFEPTILGTGGGIGQTHDFWQDSPFLVINGDIVTDIDLQKAIDFHQSHQGPVTLILHDYPEFNQISVNPAGRIQGFRQEKGMGLAFTGIHILDRRIFDFLPSAMSYDIIPIYQQMIQKGISVWAYVSQDHYWRDIGTPKSYLKIHEECLTTPSHSSFFIKRGLGGILIHPQARVEKGVEISGWACLGKGCQLKAGCRIKDSVLWKDVIVESGISISESIIGQDVHLDHNLSGEIMV